MQITITKGTTDDLIEVHRDDGTSVSTRLPKKGPVPHDAVHYIVESELGAAHGFWGMVADGRHPEEIQDIAKAAGHASASRGRKPDQSIVQIIQVERAVECFEADLWGGGADAATLRAMLNAGCEQSLVPPMAINDGSIERIRARIADFRQRWEGLDVGQNCSFVWDQKAA